MASELVELLESCELMEISELIFDCVWLRGLQLELDAPNPAVFAYLNDLLDNAKGWLESALSVLPSHDT